MPTYGSRSTFARAEYEVVFSDARSEQKLKTFARNARGNATHGTPHEAALEADAVLLAVQWSRMQDVLNQAGNLSGKVVVTCPLPMNDHDTGLVIGHTTLGAKQLQRKISRALVVAAFNTVPSEVPFFVHEARRRVGRPSLVYYGDHAAGKVVAAELIGDTGFEPLDSGALRIARYIEPFSPLVGELAYGGAGGPARAYRFERVGQ